MHIFVFYLPPLLVTYYAVEIILIKNIHDLIKGLL